jgi:hypothetical protein
VMERYTVFINPNSSSRRSDLFQHGATGEHRIPKRDAQAYLSQLWPEVYNKKC